MRVLLIGGGGREHALAWALRRSPRLRHLACAPGNPGISAIADRVPVDPADPRALAEHAARERYDLVVVGPEAPLVAGIADRLAALGVPCFGCTAAAARIEGSKVFSKRFMERHDVPTARFRVFDDLGAAERWLGSSEAAYPLVVKADGLAAGKGVTVAASAAEARAAAHAALGERRLGEAGDRIVVEEALVGREVSFFVLTDGETFVELDTCQDYKRVRDGDAGPNTGGMGAYSPSVHLDRGARRTILERIVRPTIEGLAAEGTPYQGVLYVGLMLTADGPRVLEYNARFGDPETQVLMPRLRGDWLPLLHACATRSLGSLGAPEFSSDPAVCVVMTAGGYPGTHATGAEILGLEAAGEVEGVVVFHAGTAAGTAGRCVTAGGRVLGVTAVAPTLQAARERAYAGVSRVHWPDEQHRSDIAADAVRWQQNGGRA